MADKLVARWQTRGGKHWYNLYQTSYKGKPSFYYRMDNGGGNLGSMSLVQAIEFLESRMKDAKRIDGINYIGVFVDIRPKFSQRNRR